MGRGWKIALYIWGGFWAFVLVAATVPAKQAVSNLQSWADLLGLTSLAHLFAAKAVDYVAQIGSLIAGIVGAASAWFSARHLGQQAEAAERVRNLSERLKEALRHDEK
jgi:hypothetical protein